MASLLRALARRLPFGSARFQKGSDLANNVYLEYPAPDGDPGECEVEVRREQVQRGAARARRCRRAFC